VEEISISPAAVARLREFLHRASWHIGCTGLEIMNRLSSTSRGGAMAHLRAISGARASEAHVRELLYKADHPRHIDRYIDFFGDDVAAFPETAVDCCGDLLLGSLA
jgi:hypothetical protein